MKVNRNNFVQASPAFSSLDASAGGVSLALTNATSFTMDQMALPSGQAKGCRILGHRIEFH